MRKDALFKALSDPDKAFNQQEPPERVVFFHDDEVTACCSALSGLIRSTLQLSTRHANRHALPLPDVDLPLIF